MKLSQIFSPVRCALSVALLSAFMAGCSSTPVAGEKAPVQESGTSATTGTSTPGDGNGVKQVKVEKSVDTSALAKLPRVIYFDFDSYVVKDEFLRVVEVNAKALSSDRNRRLVVEGHADERGGREYNLALGQKRAEAVAKSLTVLGATAKQLEAVSFGKERPAAIGTGEAVWAQNRRAELTPRQ
jgi:peptidoglycan-associated lipoprotein